ncbi:MAG: TPM domain-containing protein [Patescibacteria group bacterium]|nr:TPM domain-containing protein [Patescibacteria group bacterium]
MECHYKKVLFLLALAFFALPVFAYSSPGQPSGFVNDFANMMSPGAKQALEQKLVQFEKDTTNEISVVTINNLGGDTIENFAVKLFADWKIGKAKNDNGVLLLVSKEERKTKIEVGYGLEGALTDAQSFWILENTVKPAFRQNDFDGGITNAVNKIIAATKGEYIPSQKPNAAGSWSLKSIENILGLAFLVFIWLGSVLSRSKSWWAGGVIGALVGIAFIFIFSAFIGAIAVLILTPLGLLFDYLVSKNYQKHKSAGTRFPWWIGGFGGGGSSGGFGGGGFGGFGGGSSGGGGSSSGW